jgi:hypothetical protein
VDIQVSEDTFQRLEKLAVGFDTPEAVINRLIDSFENKKDSKPRLTFTPSNETQFLSLLVRNKLAEVTLNKTDGSRDIFQWEANKLTEKSNLRGNLWSGFLRGWKDKGISSADFYIYPNPTKLHTEKHIQRDMILAGVLNLKFSELLSLDDDFELVKHVDEHNSVFDYTIRFFDSCDPKVLNLIDGLNSDNEVTFGAFTDMWDALNPFCVSDILVN